MSAPEPAPSRRGHGLAIGLGVAGLVLAGVAVFGLAQVLSYDGYVGGAAHAGAGVTPYNPPLSEGAANAWEATYIVTGVLAAAGLTTAGFTW